MIRSPAMEERQAELSELVPEILLMFSRQHGIATRSELIGAGVPDSEIRRMLRNAAIVQVARGAYAPAKLVRQSADDPARQHALIAHAAARLAGPGSVASHQSAAIIHGLSVLTPAEAGLVTLTRSPSDGKSRSARARARVHIADLPPGHVTSCHGAPVTTVARTVIDLARSLPFADGVVAADSALRAGQTSHAELAATSAACARWPGVRRAERVSAFSDPRSESVLESIARVAFAEHELPPPDLQAWVGDEEGVIGRADFLWPQHRTIGEADGALKYANPWRAVNQLARDARLREAGFEVVHFTWQEIIRAPWQVVASIQAAFDRADGARAPSVSPAGGERSARVPGRG
jgi:predicted transcriptional regulator of viral defense system